MFLGIERKPAGEKPVALEGTSAIEPGADIDAVSGNTFHSPLIGTCFDFALNGDKNSILVNANNNNFFIELF